MDNNTSYSDEDLVFLAQQGSNAAYNRLFSRYYTKIQQIIYFQLSDSAQAHDLAQEVLLKVYRYLNSFKEKSQFSTWLYRITQNTIKNYYRQSYAHQQCEIELTDSHAPIVYQSPEYLLINFELGQQMELALSLLSEELRTCYGMYLFDGETYEDIAKKMDCPIGTVRSRIFRAKKLLMESVENLN